MKKLFFAALSIITASIVFWSCQKEISVETGATPTNPGGPLTSVGWQFTDTTGGANKQYSGCIDTAYYTTINNASYLRIEGSDGSGTAFYMLITAASGKTAKGTYTAAQGQAMMAVVMGSTNYVLNTNDVNFRAEVTDISDSTVNISFNASLVSSTSGKLAITAGKLKALIGRENPCTSTGGGGGTTAAVFTLTSGNTCGNAVVAGTYQTNVAATSAEKVTITVNVTTAGTYSVQTSSVSGLVFSGSGVFSSTGSKTIVLQASGTPTATGTLTIPVTAGNSSCSFPVTVTQGVAQPYGFTFLDSNINLTYYGPDTALVSTFNNQKYLSIIGATAATFDTTLVIDILLPSGNIETKTYTAPADVIYFSVIDTASSPFYYYETDPTLQGSQFTVTITSHDANTKTIIGTFRAVARKDEQNGVFHTIKNGTFKARYK